MSRKSARLRRANTIDNRVKGLKIFRDLKYRLIMEGVCVGLAVGAVISLFRLILSNVDTVRTAIIDGARQSFLMALMALLILFAMAAGVDLLMKREPLIAGSGIPQAKGEIEGRVKSNWLRVLACKFAGTVFAISAGLSLGHEGPSIQLGAMVGKGFSRLTGRFSDEEKYLIICGAGAGIAAAFNAPMAGVVFVLEEFRRKFSHKALLSTMASSITADWVASHIFGLNPVFSIQLTGDGIPLSRFWMILVLGLLLGVFGWMHNSAIDLSKRLLSRANPLVKKALPMMIIIVLAIWYPLGLGSGHGLVGLASSGEKAWTALLVLLAVKFLFSVFSSGLGVPGGVLLPLLVLGAVAGALFTEVLSPIIGVDPAVPYFVILGMAGLFSAIVRAPVTGILLICEMTGVLANLLPLAIVSLASYVVAELLGAVPIYDHPFTNIKIPEREEDGIQEEMHL